MKQITIFDVLDQPAGYVPCGYIEDLSLIGREIKFTDLEGMIGKKVVKSVFGKDYKVVKITQYFKDSDKVYRQVKDLPQGCLKYGERVNDYIHDVCGQKEAMACYEVEYICDRVGYTDKERSNESNCWESEMYCNNGRFEPLCNYEESFYELNL